MGALKGRVVGTGVRKRSNVKHPRRATSSAGLTAIVVLAVLVAAAVAGCGRKSAGPGISESGQAGLGEEGLQGGSSLARARRGLPPEEGGILGDVRFSVDSYDLNSDARGVLARNTEWLEENDRVRIEIEGHADDRGTIEYNLALGARRAKAVKDYLAVLGVRADRMSTISYGEELPVCRELTSSCRDRNRRAHFVILSQ
jgi:peptidoglycan-associated lipoprotein